MEKKKIKKTVRRKRIVVKNKSSRKRGFFTAISAMVLMIAALFLLGIVIRGATRDAAPVTDQDSIQECSRPDAVQDVQEHSVRSIPYKNEALGFELALPDRGLDYVAKNITEGKETREIIFGVPTDDEKFKQKGEKYAEVFRIAAVPLSALKDGRDCSGSSEGSPLCDEGGRELGRNSR